MGHTSVEGVRISTDHFIGGERVASSRTFADISPLDEGELGQIAAGGEEEVEMAVAAARRAFPAWAALGPQARGVYLRRFAEIIEAHVEDLAAVETTDNGSLLEASRLRVMKRSASNIRFFADYAERLRGESWEMAANNAHNTVLYQPAGVTAIVTPWNAPMMLASWRVGPALAAGNTVVLKPPEWAPLTCSLMAEYAQMAGLPAGVLNIVQGLGSEAGAALVSHPGVRRIAFTGSPATGSAIGRAAAANLTPVSFEMGGKSPLMVFADADLELALTTALGQYDNAGQVCLAGTRLLVQRSLADEFLARLREGVRSIVLGDPRQAETMMGPLITRTHLERVQGFVQRAQAEGATLAYGGGVSERLGGLYFEPTLFLDPPAGSEILAREVFGPVLTFQTFENEEEAIALGNETDYGLAATLFTRNEERARRVGAALNAGTVWINCFFVRDLGAPFGGNKQSGIGREGGLWSFDFYSDVKTVCHRLETFQA
ncbi:MAG TPA: aldehyde dehydrogenase [Ktedonobacteraceae bacterium]|nr:aldehyde dehydrogenase [Ktedonobacteraceae bacterium]